MLIRVNPNPDLWSSQYKFKTGCWTFFSPWNMDLSDEDINVNNQTSSFWGKKILPQDLTCSPNPRAAVDHHRGSLWVTRPLKPQNLHHFPLLSLHSSQEVNESHCRGGNAVVGPAEVLEMAHLSLFTCLNGQKRFLATNLFYITCNLEICNVRLDCNIKGTWRY